MAENKQVLLSAGELKALGGELKDIVTQLRLNNLTNESLQHIKKQDTTYFSWLINKYLDTAYELTENISNKLEQVCFQLLVCDDARELEAAKNYD